MSLLGNLLDSPTREAAACVIELGEDRTNPGPLNALIKSIEIVTSRTEAAAATILFEDRRIEDGTYMVSDSGLFERWQPVRLYVDFSSDPEEILRGYVSAIKPSFPASGGEVTVEISILDEAALLDREHVRDVWGKDSEMSDKAIIEELLRGTDIDLDKGSGEGQKARSLNQDSTAIKFMRERASANGYELIFMPGKVYFGPKRLQGEAQAPIMVYAGKATNCLNFAVEDDGMRPDAITFDVAPAEEGATPETETVYPDVATLGATEAAAEGGNLSKPFIAKLSREGDEPLDVARARAQAVADDNAFKLKANGELDGALYGFVLRPGGLVTVDGTGNRYGGLYYVDKVTHRFTEEGYRQVFELIRNATGEDATGLQNITSSSPLGFAQSALSGLF